MAMLGQNQYLPAKHGLSDIRIPFASSTLVPKYAALQTSTSFHFNYAALQTSTSFHFNFKTKFKICCCSTNDNKPQILKGFSVLKSDTPWEIGSVWTTMALYFFSLHVPMSFGGLSVIFQMLHQPNLDSKGKAVAVLVIETLELFGALFLLQITAKPHYKPVGFFKPKELQKERNWVFAALIGFVFLVAVLFLTSFLADRLIGAEDVNNEPLKEILLSGVVSQTACTLAYCVVAPLLEEIVYRGLLVTSLAPTTQWHRAVIISSVVFSAAHLSGENFIQLFIIGMVLGCSYCWAGDLRSSILLHSMYNAFTLLIAFFT